MKSLLKTVSAAALGLSLSLGSVQANEAYQNGNFLDMANPFTWFNMTGVNGQPNGTQYNGYVFHPLKPQNWASIVSPQEHNAFHMAMTNPATYTQYMQPGFYMEFMNPANYFVWMDPSSYKTFMDPATFSYWMTPEAYMHAMNPVMYSGMFDMNNYFTWMNPGTYMAWFDPSVYTRMMDPANYLSATMVPQNQSAGAAEEQTPLHQ